MATEIKLNEAWELVQAGLYDEAINILLELESNSTNFNVSYLLGTSYRRIDNFVLAEKYYLDAIEAKPDYDSAYLGLGITYQKQLRFTEAINSIEKAISINRFNDDAYNSLGFTYKLKGDFDKAMEAYNRGGEVLFDNIYWYINENNEFVDEATVEEKFEAGIWFKMAHQTILQNANKDGIKKISIPTGETVVKLRKNNPYGNVLFYDDGDVRYILPNMFNNFADKLSWNLQYATLLNNIGVILLEWSEKEKAKEYFIESIIFTPKNIEYSSPIQYLAYINNEEKA